MILVASGVLGVPVEWRREHSTVVGGGDAPMLVVLFARVNHPEMFEAVHTTKSGVVVLGFD